MSKELEGLLESVFDEIEKAAVKFDGHVTHGSSRAVREVGRRRLLPLLKAGEEYRKLHTTKNRPTNWRAGSYDAALREAWKEKL